MLFFTWRDGKIAGNVSSFVGEVATRYDEYRDRQAAAAANAPSEPSAGGDGEDSRYSSERLGDRVDRIEAMVSDGDSRARYYIENLEQDLGELRETTTDNARAWLDRAIDTLSQARGELQANGPRAAERLRELSGEIRAGARNLGGTLQSEGIGALRRMDTLQQDMGERAGELQERAGEWGSAARQAGEGLEAFSRVGRGDDDDTTASGGADE